MTKDRNIKESLELLGNLYTKTGYDWVMRITHILTEPTCPIIWIGPEAAKDDKDAPPSNGGFICNGGANLVQGIIDAAAVMIERHGLDE